MDFLKNPLSIFSMRYISVVAPLYNEEANLEEFLARVDAAFEELPQVRHTVLFVDNASTDGSRALIERLVRENSHCRAIFNAFNCGHLINQFYALIQGDGEAVILLASDLQDPPELIVPLVEEWLAGSSVVLLQKTRSQESKWLYSLRNLYYGLMRRISDFPHIPQVNGAGLYDQAVVQLLRGIPDHVPYLRGLLPQMEIEPTLVEFEQPVRSRGSSKNHLWSLLDLALLGLTQSTLLPLRLAFLLGAFMFSASVFVFWVDVFVGFALGLSGLVLFFGGLIGEYVTRAYRQMPRFPRVIESSRIGFERDEMQFPLDDDIHRFKWN